MTDPIGKVKETHQWLGLIGSLKTHDSNGNGNVAKKGLMKKQWLCACVTILGTFRCCPLQNKN